MSERYRRLGTSTLGKGGYGYVYPAWDSKEACTVAVKVQQCSSDEAVREMMFFQSIPSHNHLLKILDSYVDKAKLCLVFEYLYNSLSDIFHRAEGLLPVPVARDYSSQVVQGLIHLHSHSVAHRDLSMGNILVDITSNTLKIADLGLAVCASHFVLDRVVTTVLYRAPEVLLEISKLEFPQTAFDMWSYGVIMCALFSGTHLFCCDSATEKDNVELKCLQKQIDVLGPPDWQGIKALPLWSKYEAKLRLEGSGVSTDLREKLVSSKVVRRPVECPAIALLSGLLRWCPPSRMTAIEVRNHSYWDILAEVSPMSEATSRGAFEESLSQASTEVPSTGISDVSSAELSRSRLESKPRGESGVSADLRDAQQEVVPSPGLLHAVPGGMDLTLTRVPRKCNCSLNCGNTACERVKRAKSRAGTSEATLGCRGDVLLGFSLCLACKCEKNDCAKRRMPREIYCAPHMQEQSNIKKSEYMNKWSVWTMKPAWPWELKMVAMHGWMLARMCPCDLEAFLGSASVIVGKGNRLSGVTLVHLWSIAFLKWPKCVKQWASAVTCAGPGQPGVSAGSPDVQAEYYAAKSVELASHCDMDDMQWMHEQISTGQQPVLFGPIIWLGKLGMNPASDSKRRKVEVECQPDMHEVNVSLGKKHSPYRVVQNTVVWKTLLEHASEFDKKFPGGLALPESSADLLLFIDAVEWFLKGFPPAFGYADRGPKSKKQQTSTQAEESPYYLLSKTHSAEDHREQMTIETLQPVCADKNSYLESLDSNLTWKQATRMFSMCPLMISCWACLFGHVRKGEHRAVFKRASARLWQIVLQLKEKHEGVEPNLRSLAVEALERGTNKK